MDDLKSFELPAICPDEKGKGINREEIARKHGIRGRPDATDKQIRAGKKNDELSRQSMSKAGRRLELQISDLFDWTESK